MWVLADAIALAEMKLKDGEIKPEDFESEVKAIWYEMYADNKWEAEN